MRFKKPIAIWALIIVTALSGVLVGRLSSGVASSESEDYEYLKVFTEVLSIVRRNYVEEINIKTVVYGAIKGMINSLDPHSGFMPPESYKEMQADTKGEFGGLGIQIGVKEGMLTVIAPIEDTPAYLAGIKAGDNIVKIDGEITKDMTLHDAVTKMRGKKGTPVTLSIMREGWKDFKDFKIIRDIIKVNSVKFRVIDNKVGYVKISQFQERTGTELQTALLSLEKSRITSLVLDLRNNPGGLLNSAVDVSEQFLPADKLVVFIKGRTGDKIEYKTDIEKPDDSNAEKKKFFQKIPMVVLVNQGSASASEIVAGAIKDWNRAVILGVQTFGKGSVQSVIPLSDGSGLRLTTARYYTPKGITIQSTGIIPDIIVKQEVKGTKEIPVIREKDLPGHLKNEVNEEKTKGPEEMAPIEINEKDDIQLQRALELIKTWQVFNSLPKAS